MKLHHTPTPALSDCSGSVRGSKSTRDWHKRGGPGGRFCRFFGLIVLFLSFVLFVEKETWDTKIDSIAVSMAGWLMCYRLGRVNLLAPLDFILFWTPKTSVYHIGPSQVGLGARPTADVTVSVSSSDTTEGIVSPAKVVFPSDGNWQVTQTVTVLGLWGASPSLTLNFIWMKLTNGVLQAFVKVQMDIHLRSFKNFNYGRMDCPPLVKNTLK